MNNINKQLPEKENLTKKPKIAWYESNSNMTSPVKLYLQQYFQVEIFGDPEEAENLIIQFHPDLVIFDYRMEIFNGVTMYKKLKNQGLKFIPLFLSIWGSDDSTVSDIIAAGVERKAIFDKNIDPNDFANEVAAYYQEKKTR